MNRFWILAWGCAVSTASLCACGNTVILGEAGGSGGNGGASSSKAVSGSSTHAVSGVTSQVSAQNSGVVGSTNGIAVTTVGVSVVGSTNVSNVNVSSIAVSVVGSMSIAVSGVTTGVGPSTGSGPPPPGWSCTPQFYAANDGCDCGCGAFDPDCGSFSSSVCQFCNDGGSCDGSNSGCPGHIDPQNNAQCVPTAPENCNNGIDDDFDGETDCDDTDCLGQPNCPPVGWNCAPSQFLDSTCDCGCGVIDPACMGLGIAACNICNEPGSCSALACPGAIDPANIAGCVPPSPEICGNGLDDDQDGNTDCADSDCQGQPNCAPTAWTCPLAFYHMNDGCDCGCGAFDPDCPNPTAQVCQFCTDPGSCSTNGCQDIRPNLNAICL